MLSTQWDVVWQQKLLFKSIGPVTNTLADKNAFAYTLQKVHGNHKRLSHALSLAPLLSSLLPFSCPHSCHSLALFLVLFLVLSLASLSCYLTTWDLKTPSYKCLSARVGTQMTARDENQTNHKKVTIWRALQIDRLQIKRPLRVERSRQVWQVKWMSAATCSLRESKCYFLVAVNPQLFDK